ncbi:sigma factor-like helix-turn-helix DNA-binding protein [Parasphingorhabdus pacifica]
MQAVLAESASAAMLVVLETLAPAERAVFVLREVFDYPHEDIAAMLGRSSASVRQLAHRAREHVRARRPRFGPDRATQQRVSERFLAACRGGDLTGLLELLTSDVMLYNDGGGKVRAARNPIFGVEKVARFLAGIHPNRFRCRDFQLVELNGQPGAATWFEDKLDAAITVVVADGHVQWVGLLTNPDKLAVLSGQLVQPFQEHPLGESRSDRRVSSSPR